MKPLVYIEASVVSYLTARPSNDPIKTTWQTVTQLWWHTKLTTVAACVSPYVIEEVQAGDIEAAKDRLDAIRSLRMLETNAEIEDIASYLLLGGGLPQKARLDALHIACAAYHRANILLTWNFKHIANPVQLPIMRGLCNAKGYRLPELVSPLEMLES
jgi:predicted nucleic acid-binding protein